jgi:hypothetical protein
VLSLSNGTVREDWSGGPTTGSGFVVVQHTATLPQGPARTDFDGQAERERITSAQLNQYRFTAFGAFEGFPTAFDFAEFARAAIQGETGRALFRSLKSGLVTIGTSQNLSGVAGNEEQRAMFEFTLSFNEILETDLEAIRLADIYAHYEPHGTEFVSVTPPLDPEPKR